MVALEFHPTADTAGRRRRRLAARRTRSAVLSVALLQATASLVVGGCASSSAPASRPSSVRSVDVDRPSEAGQTVAPTLSLVRDAILDAHLDELRLASWPQYRDAVERFYTSRDFTPAWIRKGRPTEAALEVIELLEQAYDDGLTAEDYDAGLWDDRVSRLQADATTDVDRARFDLALTVSLMRYANDLHRGRIDPLELGSELVSADAREETIDPAAAAEELAATSKIDAFVASLSPPDPEYERLLAALRQYRELARDEVETLPRFVTDDVIRPGDAYPDLARLEELLSRLGDLHRADLVGRDATVLEADQETLYDGAIYDGAIVEAVMRFQRRHGLEPDGKIGKETQEQLSTPLARRVRQIELALERRRWQRTSPAGSVDGAGEGPAIVVNVPEFRLRAFDRTGLVAFTTNVVVGRAERTETPVFTELMRTVVFRPSWHVPASITRREIVPELEKDPSHLEREGYEIVGGDGGDESDLTTLTDLRRGALRLRQRPGPGNALGPVKFLFPNRWNVYLHGSPSTKSFARARRDLSHGCMRVADPIGLAEWVLRDQPDWDREQILDAVAGPQEDVTVTLETPIPVHVVYHTVVTAEDGEVFFLDDLYGHDARLELALEQRQLDSGDRAARLGSN